ncbi:MAG TPA: glycosyltransferase family A protein [Rhizomicrobium sp.]|nr:glycosyltransferase family A protein [Rhizomicrobium sp.]
MTGTPKLALLIPAYNAAAYLPRLLQSAHNQREPFDEILVYDDCSTDSTAAVAEQMGAGVIRGQINKGCSHGKNALARATAAEWIHFHDADDELLPNFVSRAHLWMRDGRFDAVLFPYEERDAAIGRQIATRRFDPDDIIRDARSYALRVPINSICGLYRRSAFLAAGGYDEDPRVLYNEDAAAHIRLTFAGLSFAADTEISIINHRQLNSMSAANQLKCLQAQFEVMRKTAQRAEAAPYAFEIARRLWAIVAGLASQQDWQTADAGAALAVALAGLKALPPGRLFRNLCRISPFYALRIREALIRVFKPWLRTSYPRWRNPFYATPTPVTR